MQARQVLFASMLAAVSFGALAQEIDRSETLQAKNLAGQVGKADESRSRAVVVAEARNQRATGQQLAGERVDSTPVTPMTNVDGSPTLTRADVRKDLQQWRLANKILVGDRG